MAETNTERKDVKQTGSSGGQQREPEVVLRPPVDIYEDGDGIMLMADMPGVSRERLTIEVDKDMLVLEGDARIDMSEGMEALYADVRSTRYRRSFTLSGELETGQIDANLRDGVLSVRIPKRAEVRPRRIEVRAD
ncbi:MAG: Hsp20/alpha crystallin family protein [Gammaproteobacteria bacterium]